MVKGYFLVLSMLLSSAVLHTQSDWVILEGIEIIGNKKTRDAVILRELPFRMGDTLYLTELPDLLQEGEEQVLNTGLFNAASITYKNWKADSKRIQLSIEISETWFIYPLPTFELADRNFNVWWTEQNRSLQRINFGVTFAHLNFSGWRDKLKLKIKYGYTRNYSFSYSFPFLNRKQTLGVNTFFGINRNRELHYITLGNRQEFYRDEDQFVYERLGGGMGLNWRPKQYGQHNLLLTYTRNRIDPIIATDLNPDFFLEGRTKQRAFNLSYQYDYDKRDVRAYPWKGYYYGLKVQKDGLGIFGDRDGLSSFFWYEKYLPFGEKWSLGTQVRGKYSLIRKRQPFNDYRALGFGQYTLPGYEFYVIDGQDMIMLKPSLRFKFLDSKLRFGKLIPKAFRTMPFRMALALNGGMGYVTDPFTAGNNVLSNQMLWSGGVGLDIVLYYDKVIQIQYSINHLKERGIYLHLDTNL